MEDYDYVLQYHPGKGNVVADALSRKSRISVLSGYYWKLLEILEDYDLCVDNTGVNARIFNLIAQPSLNQKIQEAQKTDLYLDKIKRLPENKRINGWEIHRDGEFRFQGRIYVPLSIRHELLEEAHHSKFAIHPGNNKMYHNIKRQYWWNGMKKDIAKYVARCMTCQLVKAKHQKPGGLLQPLPIPE